MESFCSKGRTVLSHEESGWTTYFEDLLSNNIECSMSSAGIESSSLVSDAASYAAWKSPDTDSVSLLTLGPEKICRGPRAKKRRVSRPSHHDDDALEDTASSTASSSKISNLRKLGVNHVTPENKDGNSDSYDQGRRSSSNHLSEELHRDEKDVSVFYWEWQRLQRT